MAIRLCSYRHRALVSVGAGFGISHRINGTNYRTFTEPLPRVKTATLTALKLIEVQSTQKTKTGEVLKATANDRRIEVELEALTPNATRMRSVAMEPGGLVLDSATGLEIVMQTEKVLGR